MASPSDRDCSDVPRAVSTIPSAFKIIGGRQRIPNIVPTIECHGDCIAATLISSTASLMRSTGARRFSVAQILIRFVQMEFKG
jgi:hypothetical protein